MKGFQMSEADTKWRGYYFNVARCPNPKFIEVNCIARGVQPHRPPSGEAAIAPRHAKVMLSQTGEGFECEHYEPQEFGNMDLTREDFVAIAKELALTV
jgi:hypothetical protein